MPKKLPIILTCNPEGRSACALKDLNGDIAQGFNPRDVRSSAILPLAPA
jgi:hypothetical protein